MRDNADNIMQGEVLQSSGDSGPSQFLCDSSGGLNIPGAAHADMELMQKIILLEQKIEKQAQEIQLKDRRIAELEEKMKTLQKAEDDPNSSTAEELEFRCFQLQTQIWEMEQFLHDCGLIWVGERHEQLEDLESLQDEEELPARSHWKPGKAVVSKHLIDFDLILEKVKDLNELAEEGASQIEHTPQGARLRQPEPIPLTLYQNGIVLFNGPFRPYEHPSTQQCLQDIVDGYFPSELQMCYPDGIPLQVPKLPWIRLSTSFPSPQNTKEKWSVSGVQPEQSSRVKTAEASAPDICTLRIKSESGEQTYIVKMLVTETIGDLRQHLAHTRAGDSDSYEIISTFPQRVYADNSRSLQECDLIPNASLLLRRREPSQQEGTGLQTA
ncbi:UBX domain-containing protein 11 isoform X5 [Cuculus canorus]|uniref:UBX domain-containing protein 11 isoform X5 n=1 Tax=Cuculus canorus TaxID=55661 RepID=UPI0023AA6E86|nr:UBX domain-containing protein 11 isoform X5 [Cuculus canorus]